MNTILKRYWFIIYPQDPYGTRNIGVTAYSEEDARSLIRRSIHELSFMEQIEQFGARTEAIENIDIRLLDQEHVVPNIGMVTFRGIWFPNVSFQVDAVPD